MAGERVKVLVLEVGSEFMGARGWWLVGVTLMNRRSTITPFYSIPGSLTKEPEQTFTME